MRPHWAIFSLFTLFAAISAHLILGAVEILHRPVFPWDGWLNWIYRAKAWYLSGEVTAFDPAIRWAQGATPEHPYAVAGHHYPRLLPLLTLSMASLLGSWNESLVNLPTLALSLALCAGMVVLGRRHGLSLVAAALVAYFVVSTPLIGAHMSLAGMADIWMAGSAGVGYAVLCSGLMLRRQATVIIGLLLIVAGVLIKAEGAVWLLGALLLCIIALRPSVALLAGLIATVVLTVLAAFGVTSLELPLLGTLGVSGGRLYLPPIGNFAIQRFDLGDDYVANFLTGASWNLLWYLVGAAVLVAIARARKSREAAIFLAFCVVSTSSQVVIFFFTEQGAWAEDWTAINRLPLHFVPALAFGSVCVLWPFRTRGETPRHGETDREQQASRMVPVATLACLAIAAGTVAVGGLIASVKEDSAATTFAPRTLRPITGNWVPFADGWTLQSYEANTALISTGPIRVVAEKTPIVRLVATGDNRREVTLFWRSRSTGELYRSALSGVGDLYADLRTHSAWRGGISEMGLVFYDDGESVRLTSLSLHPDSLVTKLRRFFSDRLWVDYWTLRSVNWLHAGNPNAAWPALALPLLVIALTMLLFCWRASPARLHGALAGAVIGAWLLFDTAWLYQRVANATQTSRDYTLASSGPTQFRDDPLIWRATRRALCDVVDDWRHPSDRPAERLIIAGDSDTNQDYSLLRSKYHALPVAAHAHSGTLERLPTRLADRVLVFKLRFGAANARTVSSSEAAALLAEHSGRSVRVAWEDDVAYLLLLGGDTAVPACWRSDPV